MQQQSRAYLYAVAAVVAWGTAATAFKLSLQHVSPPLLVAWSALVSLLVLAACARWRGNLRTLSSWSRRDYAWSALLGLLNPGLYYAVLFEAYARLPAQQAQPLNYAWPVVLVLLSALLLRQPIPARAIGAMLVCLLGVAVISTRGDLLALQFENPTGVALALSSTVIWAGYWLLNLRDRHDPVLRLLVNFAFGTLFAFVYALAAGDVHVPPAAGLFGAAWIGTFEMGLTFVLWISALKLSRTTAEVSGLIFLAPFLSLLVIWQVLGERIHPSTLVGLVLIVGGILALQRATAARPAS